MTKKKKPEDLLKVGRPTDYRPEYCKRVIALMTEGKSWTVVAKELGTTRETLDDWCERNPEFSDAKKRGFELSQAWWEEIARENLIFHPKDSQLNATLWYMNMKNRFGWRDTQETTLKGDKENPVVVIDAGSNPYLPGGDAVKFLPAPEKPKPE